MKKLILAVSAVAVLWLASLLTGCGASHREKPKEAVELSNASVGEDCGIDWWVRTTGRN